MYAIIRAVLDSLLKWLESLARRDTTAVDSGTPVAIRDQFRNSITYRLKRLRESGDPGGQQK